MFFCSENGTNPKPQNIISIDTVTFIKNWNIGSEQKNPIEVKVSKNPSSLQLLPVVFNVLNSDSAIVFSDSLYDDGGFQSGSGDVIAGDDVFRNMFTAQQITGNQGLYTFQFQVSDNENNKVSIRKKGISFILNNANPEIIDVFNLPQNLPSGAAPIVIEAKVFDPDGNNEIDRVTLDVRRDGSSVLGRLFQLKDDGMQSFSGDNIAGDSLYSIIIDSSFAAGKKGTYQVVFEATDNFGNKSSSLSRNIDLENESGQIIELSVDETIQRPGQSNQFNTTLVSARINDPQSLTDVDSVYFYSLKPNGELANNGNPFTMVDNGLPFNLNNLFLESGDEVADDGVYSFTAPIFNDAEPGVYIYTFYMRDRAGNLSAAAVDSIEVLP